MIEEGTDPHLIAAAEDHALILDRAPVYAGHTLIVPRTHVPTLLDASDAETSVLLARARDVGRAVMTATGATGFLLLANTIVSQSVPHVHLHVVPRRHGDGLRGFLWPRRRYGCEEEVRAMASAIRDALPHRG